MGFKENISREWTSRVRPPAELHEQIMDAIRQTSNLKQPRGRRVYRLVVSSAVACAGVILSLWLNDSFSNHSGVRNQESTTRIVRHLRRTAAKTEKSVLANSYSALPESVAYVSKAAIDLYANLTTPESLTRVVKVTSNHKTLKYEVTVHGSFKRNQLTKPTTSSFNTRDRANELQFVVSANAKDVTDLKAFTGEHHLAWSAKVVRGLQFAHTILLGANGAWHVKYSVVGATAERPNSNMADQVWTDWYQLWYHPKTKGADTVAVRYKINIPGYTGKGGTPSLSSATNSSGVIYSRDGDTVYLSQNVSSLGPFSKVFSYNESGTVTVQWGGHKEIVNLHPSTSG